MEKLKKSSTTIRIQNLHSDVNEDILYETFQTHGNVSSIKIYRDPETEKSLGCYADVTYDDIDGAKGAMDNLNFKDIPGKDRKTTRLQLGNILIKNLDPTITTQEIKDTFANFGEVLSCKVQTDDNGVSKGFALVTFSREEDAKKAIQEMDGKVIRDKNVSLAMLVTKMQTNTREDYFTNCFVKNFGSLLTDETLKEMFEPCGEIVSAKVMFDEDGCSKGFGFVSFKKHQSALKAVNVLHGKMIGDKALHVGPHKVNEERQVELQIQKKMSKQERLQVNKSGVNLYVKNLDSDIDDARLRAEFDKFGKVLSTKVMLNAERTFSLGYGFVCFSSLEEAQNAINEMNGKVVEGISIHVSLAKTKETSSHSQQGQASQQAQTNVSLKDVINPQVVQAPTKKGPEHIIQDKWPPSLTNIVGATTPMVTKNVVDDPIKSPDVENRACSTNTPKIDNLNSKETKKLLCEKIYPLVCKIAGNKADKIMGMFVELDNAELLRVMENENSLRKKIDEAFLVFNYREDVRVRTQFKMFLQVYRSTLLGQLKEMEYAINNYFNELECHIYDNRLMRQFDDYLNSFS